MASPRAILYGVISSRRPAQALLAIAVIAFGAICLLCILVLVTFGESEGRPRVRWPGVMPYVPVWSVLAISGGLFVAALVALAARRGRSR